MRFFKDNDLEIDVRWFFTGEDTPFIQGGTIFGSGNWASEFADWRGPGEVQDAPREWVNGSPPTFDGNVVPGFDGKKIAGTPEQFQEGSDFPSIPLEGAEDGTCPSCGITPDCSGLLDSLPEFIYLHVLEVSGTAPNPVGYKGMTYQMQRQGVQGSYQFSGVSSFKNPCGAIRFWNIACYTVPNGLYISAQPNPFELQGYDKLTYNPFRMDINILNLNTVPIECDVQEVWKCYIDTNP